MKKKVCMIHGWVNAKEFLFFSSLDWGEEERKEEPIFCPLVSVRPSSIVGGGDGLYCGFLPLPDRSVKFSGLEFLQAKIKGKANFPFSCRCVAHSPSSAKMHF